LRADPRVAAATRERVRVVAERLNYVPSDVGRSLSTRSTRRIALIVTDLTSPFYPYLVAPLHDAFENAGYRMELFTDRSDEPAVLQRLKGQLIDGVVLSTALLGSDFAQGLYELGVPFVFVNRESDEVPADCAIVDNKLGAALAGSELVRLGHRRIGAIFGAAETSTGRDRERGFRAALASGGAELDEQLVRRGPFSFETGYALLPELLSCDPPPTGIFCGNDAIAIGAINAARRLCVDVPGDVSLVGFDDIPMAGWEVFQLTTVRQPINEMAGVAARLLIERIEARPDELSPRRIVFEPQFIRRATLAPHVTTEVRFPSPSG
jgi:LacI family transcriptional regulator